MGAHRRGHGALPEASHAVLLDNLLDDLQGAHGGAGLQARLEQLDGVGDKRGNCTAG